MSIYIDTAINSANKYNEELCGDNVEVIKTVDKTIVVLADGLGSGVKANILSTLTVKIASRMLQMGGEIQEVVETLAETLPICQEKQIAYSTFAIIVINHETLEVQLVEYDGPPAFVFRHNKLLELERVKRLIHGKTIYEAHFQGQINDMLFLVSDGVLYAGTGTFLNLGWQWPQVADYLGRLVQGLDDVNQITSMLLTVCNNLYAGKFSDDTTVFGLKIKQPLIVSILIGPPRHPEADSQMVAAFMEKPGKKIICGGTSAKIVARELGKKLIDRSDKSSDEPPTSYIEGIDLVTEGFVTLSKTLDLLQQLSARSAQIEVYKSLKCQTPSCLIAQLLYVEATECHFYLGHAHNAAHDTLGMITGKEIMIKQVSDILRRAGKRVYIYNY